jgi:glutamyl/glutaminyl-tRNA synthetase
LIRSAGRGRRWAGRQPLYQSQRSSSRRAADRLIAADHVYGTMAQEELRRRQAAADQRNAAVPPQADDRRRPPSSRPKLRIAVPGPHGTTLSSTI